MKTVVKIFGTTTPLFYLKEGKMMAIKPSQTATAVTVKTQAGDQKLVFGLGTTPKTYYSGNRPCWNVGIETNENIISIAKDFQGNSNADVEALAIGWGAQLLTGGRNACCTGIQFFYQQEFQNEFGIIKNLSPVGGEVEIGQLKRAEIKDYLSVIQSLEIGYMEDILFSGWRRPENLLEQGWQVSFIREVGGNSCFIPFASKAEDDNAYTKAQAGVLKHIISIYGEELCEKD